LNTYGLLVTGKTEIFSDKYPTAFLSIINPMLTVLESNVGIRNESLEENFFLLSSITWAENSERLITLHTFLVGENNVFIAAWRGKKKLLAICFRKTPFERRGKGGHNLTYFVLIGFTVNLAV
jgi:hypothetical protein